MAQTSLSKQKKCLPAFFSVRFGLTEPPFQCTFVYMNEILLYKTDNDEVKVEILLHNENLWLTQAKMAELFDVQKAAI